MKVLETIEYETLTLFHWLAIVLAVVTGLVHLVLGIGALPDPLGIAALLAAGGFAGAVILFLLDVARRLVVALGIPFTASQILLWYAINEPASVGDLTAIEVLDKVVQVMLVCLLVVILVTDPKTGWSRTHPEDE